MKKHPADQEMLFLHEVADVFPRHPSQLNGLLEADAEVVDVSGLRPDKLLLTTDAIQEEIATGLYDDPGLVGWMSVQSCLSDLAAVGADTIGLLIALQLPQDGTREWLAGFQAGVKEACTASGVHVLGGDTGLGRTPSVTMTAVGYLRDERPLMRTGTKPGDILYATGPGGAGNAYAYAKLFDRSLSVPYAPMARLREGRSTRAFASSAMDTSDGLFPALSVLCSLNDVGFSFGTDLSGLLCTSARTVHQVAGLPSWMLLAGPHGDFELLFTVPPDRVDEIETGYATQFGAPLRLGVFTGDGQLHFTSEGIDVTTAPHSIPDIFHRCNGDLNQYFRDLMRQHQTWMHK